jgi:hypothetical protein
MKTIIVIAAMVISGSCFADSADDILAFVNRSAANREATYQSMMSRPIHGWEAAKADPSAYQSSKVEYTIVTLPSGKTATALTFK